MKFFVILIIFLLIATPSFVSAGLGGDVVNRISDILNFEIPAPAYVVDSGGGYSGLPFWVVILTFMLLFAVIWLASGQVPLFAPKENMGARKAFVVALALLTIFTTPVVKWILKAIKYFTALTIIALCIAGIYTIYVLTRSNIAKNMKTDAASSKVIADAKQSNAATRRQNEQTKTYNEKTDEATRHGLKHQSRMIRQMEEHMDDVVRSMHRATPRLRNPEDTVSPSEANRMIRNLNTMAVDLGKLLSYRTPNDRILSGMSNRNYSEDNSGSLTSVAQGTSATDYAGRRVQIQNRGDTQTNDLGHAINGLIDIIRHDGIRGSNVTKITELALNASNILQRMKRDIVLEQQMIEKI